MNKLKIITTAMAIFLSLLMMWGCRASPSPTPSITPSPTLPTSTVVVPTPGGASGMISGKVTNSLTGAPLAPAVTTTPAVQGENITVNADGTYSAELPVGPYTITFSKDNFTPLTVNVNIVAGKTFIDVTLKPVSRVVIDLGSPASATPGDSVDIRASVQVLDGSSLSKYQWSQTSGVPVKLDNTGSDTVRITLGPAADYKAQLLKLQAPLDRFQVQPINPYALDSTRTAKFQVAVTTSSGTYTGFQTVNIDLPYAVSGDIGDVPIRVPVLLHGKNQSGYNWTISPPAGSKTALDSPGDQNPSFTPDVPGKYTVTETKNGQVINVYAGTWVGAITGEDDQGKPVTAKCSICHNGSIAPDQFANWRNTGHAAIFTKNLNTSANYGEDCFSCHTVGFDKSAENGGFDDAPDYAAFLNSGLLGKPSPDNWSNMLVSYPMAARLANVQCEDCHGPNDKTGIHGTGNIATQRISLSSDLCAQCHGEPLRHGRFQQWQESGHSSFTLALSEGTVDSLGGTAAHCGRCHSAQGFLAWIGQEDLTKFIQGKNGNATVNELNVLGLTADMVQPQTCTVCHDPHAEGASSGPQNTATVRIENNTPLLPAGFAATNVGKGAICITCHNTRNGRHDDNNPPTNYTAPHSPAQGDVLMGQNAYFVPTGQRSPHSFLTNTCATCHMEATPPPPEFSYEGTGTNHSFKASPTICANCHSQDFQGEAYRTANLDRINGLADKLGAALLARLPASIVVKDYTPHQNNGKNYDVKSDAFNLDESNITSISPVEIHGQAGFSFKLANPVTVNYSPAGESPHTLSVTQIQVQFGDTTSDGQTAVVPPGDTLVKANWNYYLLEGDGSGGIHNPEYVNNIINATLQALP